MKFIVIGCGSMGRRRIRHALRTADARVGVWDIRDDRMAEIEAMFDVERVTGIDAFAGFGADAIFICVPPAEHQAYLDWAIDAGIPFMVEQPITHDLDQLDGILEGARRKRLVTHVSNNHRHSAETAAIKSVIDSGDLGRPLAAMVERGEWLPDWHAYEPYTDYYPSSRARGGGLDAICDIDWLRYLFGEVRDAKSMCAKKSDLDIDTFDLTQFLLDFDGGVQVVMQIDMLQRTYAASVKIVFERGTVIVRVPEPVLRVYSRDANAWREIPIVDDRDSHQSMQGKDGFNFVEPMYQRDTQSFLDRLAAGDADLASLRDGIENLRVVHPLVRP